MQGQQVRYGGSGMGIRVGLRKSTGEGAVKSLKEASQLAQDQHPADALGDTLGRINTLLSAVTAMFEPDREAFAVHNGFVMHSLMAVQDLTLSAQSSLGKLHEACDLTLLGSAPEANEAEPDLATAEAQTEYTEAEPIPFAPLSAGARFVDEVTSSAANTEFSEILSDRPSIKAEESRAMQEGFAQNYLELLRKLTAAEIFAAEQQALSPPGTQHQLLPLLRSLREDFQKIHSAA